MKMRNDFLDKDSPEGIDVIQITTDPNTPAAHVYMEAQVFTPDSKHFLLHSPAVAHNADVHNPQHQYLRCDIEDDCRLTPLITGTNATAPAISPDGQTAYYFTAPPEHECGGVLLNRIQLDGAEKTELLSFDGILPGTSFRVLRVSHLSTISSDGERLALPCFAKNPEGESLFALLIFDQALQEVRVALSGTTWCNMHAQYSRSLDPAKSHDIMIQENHGYRFNAKGLVAGLKEGSGADVHVVKDNGTDFRTFPWGRDIKERCSGHQCWCGRSEWGLSTVYCCDENDTRRLIAGKAPPDQGHNGLNTEGGIRYDLSRDFPAPRFFHFGTDISGHKLISDQYRHSEGPVDLYFADISQFEKETPDFVFLLNSHTSISGSAHAHPFLSPDGTRVFFNSDESGINQAYMISGLYTL